MSPNIALVVLDSMRYDYFAKEFDWLSGRWFTNAYSTSHWTIPAHASLFTGYYASEVGAHSKTPTLDCSKKTLAEELQQEGYRTNLFTANANLAYWDGWDRGFQKVVDPSHLHPEYDELVDWTSFAKDTEEDGITRLLHAAWHCFEADCSTLSALRQGYRHWTKSDADGGTEAIKERVKESNFGENEFLTINLMETHTPYHPPNNNDEPVNVVIGDAFAEDIDDKDYIKESYHSSAKYLSETYKELFSELNDNFDIIITVGDHGEMLGESGMWNHGYGIYPELVKVPLVISGSKIKEATSHLPVNLNDVHRTIADLANLGIDSRGRNILEKPEKQNLITEFHGFLPWHKEQFRRKGVPDETYPKFDSPLYGIIDTTGEYAYETHRSGIKGSKAIEDPRELINEKRDTIEQREISPIDEEVGDAVKDRLKDLGYA